MLTLEHQLVTEFHRDLATDDWLASLACYVQNVISNHPEYHTADGTGTVRSNYNEERYMGPNSICKFVFEICCDIDRISGEPEKDCYLASAKYESKTQTFEIQREETRTKETETRKAKDRDEQLRQELKDLENLDRPVTEGYLVDSRRGPELKADISLLPSFDPAHKWNVRLEQNNGQVIASCENTQSCWRLSDSEFRSVPPMLRGGWFGEPKERDYGLDGIVVAFNIQSGRLCHEASVWCPAPRANPEYTVLLRWCWNGLYGNSDQSYRLYLEQLHSYFNWGVPIVRTVSGIRIFGGITAFRLATAQLSRWFERAKKECILEIDMSSYKSTPSRLHREIYPIFLDFHRYSPETKWKVNKEAENDLRAAGISDEVLLKVER